ncbi:hypothetical protein H4R21_003586 [Coemansia helicoidea]|uniref:Uncharacterized protein n=1 Tax=Coemansia helicoidea TaxID=1286919 RepID=A0ACC1L2W3_9FUNG|nr:hypothetical protein H4R21_003586 [Coemansia helicoidea]
MAQDSAATQDSVATHFPQSFLGFLRDNGIDPSIYDVYDGQPRYVRIVRHAQRSSDELRGLVAQIEEDAQCAVTAVDGVAGFLAIADRTVRLAQLRAYRERLVVGMDASSGIAVQALAAAPGHNVLDLCCAPGAKLLYLAETVGDGAAVGADAANVGSVTGVDISPHRIGTCRSLIKRHAGAGRMLVRLYAQDGTVFSAAAPRARWWDPLAARDPGGAARGRQRGAADEPLFAAKLMRTEYACSGGDLYDRVLVDAECTHDGSLAHVHKYGAEWGWGELGARVHCDADMPFLQSRLLENGWRLLRPGGLLVYSTCSLSRLQNEHVLGGFLARHGADEACLEPVFGGGGGGGSGEGCPGPRLRGIATSPAWAPATDDDACATRPGWTRACRARRACLLRA